MTDAAPVIDAIYAFRRSKAMFAAVELKVFDRAETGVTAADFPGDTGAIERLLDTCVALGFLSKAGSTYRNTPVASEYLRHESPRTMVGYILYSNAALYPMWGHLERALSTGSNQWEPTFGFPPASLFDHFFVNDAQRRAFIAGMHGFGLIGSPRVIAAFDLSGFRRMVDLGGATGHLALAAVERYPQLTAAVFDLPAVVPLAREYTAGRVDVIAGDFFRDPLPSADLYAVSRILHDWSEPKIENLLGRIHQALPEGGALLIAETLLDDNKTGPLDSLLQSLNMLVCTDGHD